MADDNDDLDDKTMIMAPSVKKQAPPKAKLVCVDTSVLGGRGGAEIFLDGREITIGRGDENIVTLKAEGVSRAHARVYPGDGIWGVEDAGSTNGVLVNKTKVEQAWMKSGDVVSIGRVHYKYTTMADGQKAAPAAPDIDISDTDKTMVMRPTVKPAPAAGAAPAGEAAAAPTVTRTQTAAAKPAGGRPGAARPQASQAKQGSSMGLMIMIVVGIIVVVGAVVMLL